MCAALARAGQEDLQRTEYEELIVNGAPSTQFHLKCRDDAALQRVNQFVRDLNYAPVRIERQLILRVTVNSEELKTQFIHQITNQYRNAVIRGPRSDREGQSPRDVQDLNKAFKDIKLN